MKNPKQPLNETVADQLRKYTLNLLRFSKSLYQRVAEKELKALEKRLIERLNSSGAEGSGDITDFDRKRFQQMLDFAQATIDTTYKNILDNQTTELHDLAEADAEFFAAVTLKTVGVELVSTSLTRSALEDIVSSPIIEGAPSEEWWKTQSEQTKTRFKNTIRQGMLSGESTDQLVRRVRGTKAEGFKDGFMDVTRREAAALVRSSVLAVSNRTRLETLQANAEVVKAYMQISTLDSRTSEICMAYSGKQWDTNFQPIGHSLPFNGGPPRHWNCRSTLVPVLKTWDEMGIDGLAELDAGTRASMDGQVPEDLTFDKWLKAKPSSFQDEMLGKGKADLFRADKITLTDLVNSKGNVLTLEQLKQSYR